jgi:hypothetical protein
MPRRPSAHEHIEADGPTVFSDAGKVGLEGIVLKSKNSPYAPAARRTSSTARTRLARRCGERRQGRVVHVDTPHFNQGGYQGRDG